MTFRWQRRLGMRLEGKIAVIIGVGQGLGEGVGIRANCIPPGLMDTPMTVDTRARAGNRSRAEVAVARGARLPLRGCMGTAWEVGQWRTPPCLRRGQFHHRGGAPGR